MGHLLCTEFMIWYLGAFMFQDLEQFRILVTTFLNSTPGAFGFI